MKKPSQDTFWHWWNMECLNMRHEHLMRLIGERDRMNEMIRALSEEYGYLRRQIAQAEPQGLRELDPCNYRMKEEAN